MPNGYHQRNPPAHVGLCPHCNSPRIRIRRGRHQEMLWRCRSCNKVFRTPGRGEIVIPPGSSGPGFVPIETIARSDHSNRAGYPCHKSLGGGWPGYGLSEKIAELVLRAQRGNLVAETAAVASTGLPRRYAPRNDKSQGLEFRNFLAFWRRFLNCPSRWAVLGNRRTTSPARR